MTTRRIVLGLSLLAALAWWFWPRDLGSDEERIRRAIRGAADAVEAGRAGKALAIVSDSFRHPEYGNKAALRLVLAGYIASHPDRYLYLTDWSIAVDGDEAEVEFIAIGTVGGRLSGPDALRELAGNADARRVECKLLREDGEWRVVEVDSRPVNPRSLLTGE